MDARVALVTGANHGIGAATAAALAAGGAGVLVAWHRLGPEALDDDPARPATYGEQRRRDGEEVAVAIREAGGPALAVEADLTDADVVPALFDAAEAALGPVSLLVHNASGWRKDTFLDPGDDHLGRRTERVSAGTMATQLAVDARGGALLISELARRHLVRSASWGRVVTLTSGGPGGFPGEVSYGAAKAALENLTMSAATELGPLGITANVVYPPATDTGWLTPQIEAAVVAASPLRHVGRPEEVAEVIAWLCSDAARFVTGNVIRMR